MYTVRRKNDPSSSSSCPPPFPPFYPPSVSLPSTLLLTRPLACSFSAGIFCSHVCVLLVASRRFIPPPPAKCLGQYRCDNNFVVVAVPVDRVIRGRCKAVPLGVPGGRNRIQGAEATLTPREQRRSEGAAGDRRWWRG